MASDLGQKGNALPLEGFAVFIDAMRKKGFTDQELNREMEYLIEPEEALGEAGRSSNEERKRATKYVSRATQRRTGAETSSLVAVHSGDQEFDVRAEDGFKTVDELRNERQQYVDRVVPRTMIRNYEPTVPIPQLSEARSSDRNLDA
jgi:hypothetical protein